MSLLRRSLWVTALLLLSGCQAVQRHALAVFYFSEVSAGYAGRYRLATGHWPATVAELEEFACMRGRAEQYGMRRMDCAEVVALPFRTELQPVGKDLWLRYFDSANNRLCSLRLRAPPREVSRWAHPMIVIKTTVFSCPRAAGTHRPVEIS
jgi:hypothetical protein